MLPLFEDGSVLVERQFRYPHDRVLWEIPAGKLDSKAEAHLAAVKRELYEETGYTADKFTSLGLLYTTPAFVDEVIEKECQDELLDYFDEVDGNVDKAIEEFYGVYRPEEIRLVRLIWKP